MHDDSRIRRNIVSVLKYLVLIFGCLMVVIPLLVVFIGSFKSNTEFLSTGVFDLPSKLEFSNYKTAFVQGEHLRKDRKGNVPSCNSSPQHLDAGNSLRHR